MNATFDDDAHDDATADAYTDYYVAILLRCLTVVAIGLAVDEVRLPGSGTGEAASLTGRDGDGDDGGAPLLPTGAVAKKRHRPRVGAVAALVAFYMASAISIVYVNAAILAQWPYAATLMFIQMVFCSCAAHGAAALGYSDPAATGMTPRLYARTCLPLAALYAVFLYGSNAVYAYLPVGFIQVLKPVQGLMVYVLLVLARREAFGWRPAANLLVIVGAVGVASLGKFEVSGWSTIGFTLMMVSNLAFATYLVGQQVLLTSRSALRRKLDALTTLYFLGPAAAVALLAVAASTEWRSGGFSLRRLRPGLLVLDCLLAFALNCVQIAIVGRVSALAYMFAGYAKGFLTVAISVAFLHESINAIEAEGYGLMLAGQVIWSLRKLRGGARRREGGAPIAVVRVAAAALAAYALYAAVRPPSRPAP